MHGPGLPSPYLLGTHEYAQEDGKPIVTELGEQLNVPQERKVSMLDCQVRGDDILTAM